MILYLFSCPMGIISGSFNALRAGYNAITSAAAEKKSEVVENVANRILDARLEVARVSPNLRWLDNMAGSLLGSTLNLLGYGEQETDEQETIIQQGVRRAVDHLKLAKARDLLVDVNLPEPIRMEKAAAGVFREGAAALHKTVIPEEEPHEPALNDIMYYVMKECGLQAAEDGPFLEVAQKGSQYMTDHNTPEVPFRNHVEMLAHPPEEEGEDGLIGWEERSIAADEARLKAGAGPLGLKGVFLFEDLVTHEDPSLFDGDPKKVAQRIIAANPFLKNQGNRVAFAEVNKNGKRAFSIIPYKDATRSTRRRESVQEPERKTFEKAKAILPPSFVDARNHLDEIAGKGFNKPQTLMAYARLLYDIEKRKMQHQTIDVKLPEYKLLRPSHEEAFADYDLLQLQITKKTKKKGEQQQNVFVIGGTDCLAISTQTPGAENEEKSYKVVRMCDYIAQEVDAEDGLFRAAESASPPEQPEPEVADETPEDAEEEAPTGWGRRARRARARQSRSGADSEVPTTANYRNFPE